MGALSEPNRWEPVDDWSGPPTPDAIMESLRDVSVAGQTDDQRADWYRRTRAYSVMPEGLRRAFDARWPVGGSMTGDQIRAVVLDASGDIRPDESRRATYTDAMRAYWDELQQWYRDHPGAIIEPSNELEIDTDDNPGIIEEALGPR